MQTFQRRQCIMLVLILLSYGLLGGSGHAHATTGPYNNLPNSKYKVPAQVQELYRGQYVLKSSARGARLSTGAMGIEISTTGYLYGVAQFYGYDQSGSRTIWVATLYNFRQSHNHMVFDLLASGTTRVVGHLSVTRAKSGDFAGQIQLVSGTYAISWHKISSL